MKARTFSFDIEISSIHVLSFSEQMEKIRNNPYLHPWTKLTRIVQRTRIHDNMLGWTVESDQKLINLTGIDVYSNFDHFIIPDGKKYKNPFRKKRKSKKIKLV